MLRPGVARTDRPCLRSVLIAASVALDLLAACAAPADVAVNQLPEARVPAPEFHDEDAPMRQQAGEASSADAHTGHDHCVAGELPDARAMRIIDEPDTWRSPRNGAIDMVLPKDVLDWMGARAWEASHDAWHNVRRCRRGFAGNPLCARPELVPAAQECASTDDGYQFLVMHRHMMQALRQAFPATPDLFAGFPAFPFDAEDVPSLWRDRFGNGWSAAIRQTATVLEDIEHQLARFPTEGDLGRFIQCGGTGSGASSIHGALHFKWVVNDSPYSLGKQTVNIDNYMFWKLHGWIDRIWERYRAAKGLAPNEPKLREALVAQCREMETLGRAVGKGRATNAPTAPLPEEHGRFHETVRPILEKYCSGCHSEASPEGGLTLGGQVSSTDVVKGLVGVSAQRGGQLMRVKAGAPAESWLYLKVAGLADGAGCRGTCNTGVMPPTGQVTLTSAELDSIRSWIAAGAPAPTR